MTDHSEITVKDGEFCIKTESNFTHNVYHNICTGEAYTVPTGTFDYVMNLSSAVILIFSVVILASLSGLLVRMFFE